MHLADHDGYWVGMEHVFFVKALSAALERGPYEFFAQDTDRRSLWFAERDHLFPEIFLVGCYSYLEGELGSGWIGRHGGRNKRELYVLRIVRDAAVHSAGDINRLDRVSAKRIDARRGRPPDKASYVRRFVTDLRKERVTDQNGIPVPMYLTVDRAAIGHLTSDSFRRFRWLTGQVLRNANRLPNEAPAK
jgi:hypothetical protein